MAKRASRETANGKLGELKARHFWAEGREERIAKALQDLEAPAPGFTLDRDTWKWITEDADREDL